MSGEKYADLACPHCLQRAGTRVVDSRGTRAFIRRRRECLLCSKRFTTREFYAEDAVSRSAINTRLSMIENTIAKLRDDLSLSVVEEFQ